MNIFNTTVIGLAIKTVTNHHEEVTGSRQTTDHRRSIKDSNRSSNATRTSLQECLHNWSL